MAPPQLEPAPAMDVPIGTALEDTSDTPTLFTSIQIRGLYLQNRFVVSPMGTWSSPYGHLTDFHLVHHGAFAFRGAALTIVESTSVTPNGRTSPQDSGLWQDSQIPPLKRVVEFVHALGQKIGIQLNHAGFKAGMLAPRVAGGKSTVIALEQDGGWPDDVWSADAEAHTKDHIMPKALSAEQIEELIQSFGAAARRAIQAGVDMIAIHAAHGYLIHQFLSPLTNHRTDKFGGNFENRARFARRVIASTRKEMPNTMPLSVRISATEWMEWGQQPAWDFEESLKLALSLPDLGVDVLEISSGGHRDQKIDIHPRYQTDLAARMRRELRKQNVKLHIAAVGFIDSPQVAEAVVRRPHENFGVSSTADGETHGVQADLALVGRQFLREPEFVLRSAQELGVKIQWPYQYEPVKPKHI